MRDTSVIQVGGERFGVREGWELAGAVVGALMPEWEIGRYSEKHWQDGGQHGGQHGGHEMRNLWEH